MVLRAVGLSKEERKAIQDEAAYRAYITHAWMLAKRHNSKLPNDMKKSPLRLIEMARWITS
jgi:hypothetical protein